METIRATLVRCRRLKTLSENIHMHALQTCNRWLQFTCTCVLQFAIKITPMGCTEFCAHVLKYAHECVFVQCCKKYLKIGVVVCSI